MPATIPLIANPKQLEQAQKIARQWGFELRRPVGNDHFILKVHKGCLQIRKLDEPALGPVHVDFTDGKSEYRRKFGGGRRQGIAKAIGLKKDKQPYVVDATAGLGRDAFVLACLKCRVHMIERSTVIAALLEDGLNRAKNDAEIGAWVSQRMSMEQGDSLDLLKSISPKPDVIYLDPMYPAKKKAALAKKEMHFFQSLIGPDKDGGELLTVALDNAQDRVVVKRPSYAEPLAEREPQTSIHTRNHRFDIYLTCS